MHPKIGLILVQDGCLPEQLRHFLEASQVGVADGIPTNPPESVGFHVLPASKVSAALEQGLINRPALWVDEKEASTGTATLHISYCLGNGPLSQPLPVKPLKLQPNRKGAGVIAAYRSFVTSKTFIQLFRVVHILFPVLERWDRDLRSSDGIILADAPQSQLSSMEQIKAKSTEDGVLLEVHSAQTGITARGQVSINFRLACIELQTIDDEASAAPSGTVKCLRSVGSLEEAISALKVRSNRLLASPSKAPPADASLSMPFQSPTKPPRRPKGVDDIVADGVALVNACSSAQLRDGAILLQTAAGRPGGATAAIACGAMEALIAAASTVLPSSIMGPTEQLTLLILTISSLLDADQDSGGQGVVLLVAALINGLQVACANPILLCKLLVALLQRPDVRLEAIQQDLWHTISSTYLRKSPLLEPLASALLSPTVVGSSTKARRSSTVVPADAESIISMSQGSPGSPGSRVSLAPSPVARMGKLSVPRLHLPAENDTQIVTPSGGLTRATRRELTATPSDWHPTSPAPWSTPRTTARDTSAMSEMEGLAEALGESLMAMDLPSAVAHKRRADLLKDTEADVSGTGLIPPELLDGSHPSITARQQTLQAHAIFTTARSLRSLDSTSMGSVSSAGSQGKGTDPSREAGGSSQPSDSFSIGGVADAEEVKNLLLQGMMASLPLPVPPNSASATPSSKLFDLNLKDPAPILAAEVLSLPASAAAGLTPLQETLRSNCLQLLARIALREEGSQSLGMASISVQHVFLAATGAKLAQVLSGGAQTSPSGCAHAAQLMHTAAEYVMLTDIPSAALAVAQHCLGPISLALAALLNQIAADINGWDEPAWQLFHGLMALLAPVLTQCNDADAGRSFIITIMGDYKTASMFVAVAEALLINSTDVSGSGGPSSAAKAKHPAFQRDLLTFFAALAGLLARQPALSDAASSPSSPTYAQGAGGDVLVLLEPAGRGQKKKMTRRHALNFFNFLVCPSSDFVRRVLDHSGPTNPSNSGNNDAAAQPTPPSSSAVRLRPALFDLLKAVFGAPGSPFVIDKAIADHYVRFHFIQFLKLYHNPQRDHQAPFLCRQHMAVLLAIASSNAPHVRHRFQQLSVVDFFVRELSLEFESTQAGGAGRLGGGTPEISAANSAVDLVLVGATAAERPSSAGKVQQASTKKNSPAGSLLAEANTTPLPGSLQARHKRGRSQSGMSLLPLSGVKDSSGSPWSTPSPPIPKLRLPGSGPRSLDSSGQGAPPSDTTQQRLSFSRGGTSRLGREAAAAAAAAAAAGTAPVVPSLSFSGLNLDDDDDDDDEYGSDYDSPSPPGSAHVTAVSADDSNDDDDERISTVAAVPVPPLELPRQPAGTASGATRPLDRAISAAISLDKGWMPSARTAAAASEAAEQASATAAGLEEETTELPSGFVFSGDLDEDVERLEALERAGHDEESDEDATTSGSSAEETEHPPQPRAPQRLPPGLGLNLSRLGQSVDSTSPSEGTTPTLGLPPLGPSAAAAAVPRLRVPLQAAPETHAAALPDSPPPRPVPPPVPRLPITASMHSTLEARMASAELQVALEAEHSHRKAGRSFFGDLERRALGKGKMQAATLARRGSRSGGDIPGLGFGNLTGTSTPVAGTPGIGESAVSYAEERSRRLVYRDSELHLQVLVLVFTLILDPQGQLDQGYCDQYPWDRKLQNIPFVLHHHLNRRENRDILPRLLPALHALGSPALRLLRTLCSAFFRPHWYTQRARISGVAGAYATVYRCALPAWAGDKSVVLKLLDTPKHIQDRCAQVDFHSEVTILDTLAGRPSACQMYDYGLDPRADALLLVLKDYRCSLKQWRAAQPADPAGHMKLYYAVFREVVVAVGQLLEAGIIHFDLKCDNILLEPLPGQSEADFWAPKSATPPFKVVLADFGESKISETGSLAEADALVAPAAAGGAANAASGATTSRARGTDAFKSPEMLLVGGAVHKGHRAYDRRRRQGAGAASDVWSLGCLLYELVTGRLLFSDTDWLQLVARVTSTNMPLITDERAEAVSDLPGVLDLLQYILVRDPALRPTLNDTLAKLDMTLALNARILPPHKAGRGTLPQHLIEAPSSGSMTGGLRSASRSQEEPLPLVAALPVFPKLFVGPTAVIQHKALREADIGRVIVISGSSDATATELSGPEILADETLSGYLESAAGVGAACQVVNGPQDGYGASAAGVLRWAESALSLFNAPQTGERPVLLAPEPGREGAAALLSVMHAVHAGNCTTYQAMVKACHWGIDLHMRSEHLEALRLLGGKAKDKGKKSWWR